MGFIADSESAAVQPLGLDELTTRAETIFLGRVVDSWSYWDVNPSGRFILTRVVFAVERMYKGPPAIQTSLEFMGGTIDDTTLQVEGMPTFARGDREVLFVSAAVRSVNPIVGATFGRFRVESDARGQDTVTTIGSSPLPAILQIEPPPAAATARSMSLQQFEFYIHQALGRARR